MTFATMLVPTILFWGLAVASVFVRPRYAVFLMILIVQLDLTGIAFYSDTSLGWENGVKVVLVPTILLLRMKPIDLLPSAFRFPRNCWLVLFGYAAVSILWSPYRLSGVKLMGYFYSYSVLLIIFACAWRRHWFTRTALISVTSVALLFAVLQTYVLGNAYGDPEYDNRFTTFADPQSFAPFLICMIVLLILCNRRTIGATLASAAALIGLVLTGSRSNLIAFVWVALVIGVAFAKRSRRHISLSLLVRNVAVGCLIVVLLGVFVLESLPTSRLTELLDVVTSYDKDSLESVGTFAWRLTVYAEAIKEISGRSWKELAVGSGSSSGANVGLQTGFFKEQTVDPNRVIHDEFLRSLYEWGALGLLAFLLFLGSVLRLCIKLIKLTSSPYAWACLAIFGPLLIGLLVENIFADGASPGGVGYCLIFASMIGQLRPAPEPAPLLSRAHLRPTESTG